MGYSDRNQSKLFDVIKYAVVLFAFIIVIGAIIVIYGIFFDRAGSPINVEPIPITLENIADHVGEKIVVEGKITDAHIGCPTFKYCFQFVPPNNSYTNHALIMVEIEETTDPGKPNCLLATEYTNGNTGFSFYTKNGQTLSRSDSFRVTGIVKYTKYDSRDIGAYWILVSTIEPGK